MSGRKIQVNKGQDLSSTINSVRLLKETNMPLNNGSLNKNFIATMNKVIKRLVTYSTFIELILFGLGENQTKIKK
jgi:hypothetical protein